MIVEVQGMGFRTRVRLPSSPLGREVTNTVQRCSNTDDFSPLKHVNPNSVSSDFVCSAPPDHEVTNPRPIRFYEGLELAVYRHCFALILNLDFLDE